MKENQVNDRNLIPDDFLEFEANQKKVSNDNITEEEVRNELLAFVGKDKVFQGFCTKSSSGGELTVDYKGVKCLMERKEVSIVEKDAAIIHRGLCNRKVGTIIKFMVVSATPDGKIYISRKSYVEKVRNYLDEKLVIGSKIKGKVVNIDEYIGCFVDIGGDMIGVIPRKNLENLFVKNISDHVSEGELIEAVVADIVRDAETGKIESFGLNRKLILPSFEELVEEYNEGDLIIGEVKAINETGIYCSVGKHLDALCNFNADITVRAGDQVRMKIRKIKLDRKRITGRIVAKV